ncbi:hypothetical protein GQ57_02870 [Burkholderia sp. MSh2]|uniref:PF11925 family protein n=1 Tax=Burkholderia paludis TaxID=1506587 RepID=A0A6J5EP93_9BURK|nr:MULTISPECIES: DUF3443 family protein [Burkholderia]KEZ07132.1 hypothetical protein GQ57_02870 [Burkholderia sp. MSh2]KFG98727.1 hypothetical protein GQ56_0101800 [Burkholderia paludis]CAB3768259.1 hypothetical protein LMG30113_05665 [Burkholderia paludis]VWC32929.1 PF11925 family protein [Burkholderia paludis]
MRIPRTFKRWLGVLGLAAATAVLVTACGGGDGGSSSNTGNNGNSGSGSDGNSGNTAVITVNAGVANVINIPTVSLKVCAPGTSNCQVVNNVLVDTASYGLRLVGSAVSGVLGSLPQVTSGGSPVAECGKFVSSYTWGSVRTVDLSIGSEQASSLPVQIIGDLGTTNVPSSCTNGGASANSASALGANGILGIGPAPVDCGTTCATSTSSSNNNYYACPNGNNANCTVALVPVSQQVANPVPHFADNSGLSVTMPGISSSGQASATGTLTFGLPDLTGKTVMTSTTTGDVNATFLGRNVTAFFDTGSNAYFFNDSSQTACSKNPQFYCPTSSPASYSATLSGQNGVAATVSMSVANADSLFANSSTFAFNDIAGPFGSSAWLDIGLPYFYGRTIYIGMDKTASGGPAPFVAF